MKKLRTYLKGQPPTLGESKSYLWQINGRLYPPDRKTSEIWVPSHCHFTLGTPKPTQGSCFLIWGKRPECLPQRRASERQLGRQTRPRRRTALSLFAQKSSTYQEANPTSPTVDSQELDKKLKREGVRYYRFSWPKGVGQGEGLSHIWSQLHRDSITILRAGQGSCLPDCRETQFCLSKWQTSSSCSYIVADVRELGDG